MTENKRYTCDIHRIFDNKEQLACADTMDDAEIIVDRLSQQDEEIQQLKQDLNKKMKFVAIQESESTIRVDFDEFVQLCEDSNDLKEKEERIKELEKENKSLQIEVLGQSEEIEILSDENKRLKQGLKQQCLNFMEMLDDMGIAYLLNDDLEYILGLVE